MGIVDVRERVQIDLQHLVGPERFHCPHLLRVLMCQCAYDLPFWFLRQLLL